jgi:hypothetical protein
MTDKPAPEHINRFVEELVECGVQLASMLEHMYRFDTDDPERPRPPQVLRKLVAETIAPALKGRRQDVQRATSLLLRTSKTIEREIYLVNPEFLDDEGHLTPEFFEDDDAHPELFEDDGPHPGLNGHPGFN